MKNFIRIQTINAIHEMLGLEKPKHPMVSVIPITDAIVNFDYVKDTYVLDFYQIALKEGLSGSFLYGRNQYDFSEGTMIFTQPGQTIQVNENENYEKAKGWILLFHPELIRKSELDAVIQNYPFFEYGTHEALHLSEDEKRHIYSLVSKIAEEYQQKIDAHTQEIIIGTLAMLLKYCQRYYDRQFYTRKNLHQGILVRFEKMLKAYFDSDDLVHKGLPTVTFSGEQLGLSGHYLSELLKKETGQSAKAHIQSYAIDKAKRLLLNTNQTINEVAYALGFEYPHHFSKLFKLKTGHTPSSFRKVS